MARKQKAWPDQSQSLGCSIQKTQKSLDTCLAQALTRAINKCTALNTPKLFLKQKHSWMASSLAYNGLTPHELRFLFSPYVWKGSWDASVPGRVFKKGQLASRFMLVKFIPSLSEI